MNRYGLDSWQISKQKKQIILISRHLKGVNRQEIGNISFITTWRQYSVEFLFSTFFLIVYPFSNDAAFPTDTKPNAGVFIAFCPSLVGFCANAQHIVCSPDLPKHPGIPTFIRISACHKLVNIGIYSSVAQFIRKISDPGIVFRAFAAVTDEYLQRNIGGSIWVVHALE